MDLINSKIIQAANFAAQKHKKQIRKDKKTPYIAHILAVSLLAMYQKNSNLNCVISSILHDTIEDTDTKIYEIEKLFGKKIASIVVELTDEKNVPIDNRKKYSIKKVKEYSKEAALVKFCDILCNIEDLRMQIIEDISIIYAFNSTIKEKIEFEKKRIKQFNKYHKEINTSEVEKCLNAIKSYLVKKDLYK